MGFLMTTESQDLGFNVKKICPCFELLSGIIQLHLILSTDIQTFSFKIVYSI